MTDEPTAHHPTNTPGPGDALFQSELPLAGVRRGKVRDVYPIDDDSGGPRVLIVATDRLSAFDVVLPTPVPGKGRVLTEIATFWLRWIEARGICPTHLLPVDPDGLPALERDPRLAGRCTVARRCEVVPIECVVRGFLEGSGWREYVQTGSVCGVDLPKGLARCAALPEPIFTPATKADDGEHDENITFERACEIAGRETMEALRRLSIQIYTEASLHARERGIIIADTKFEFGIDPGGRLMLVDEALTPDSSRFWPADGYEPGHPQPSFDKQFVREHLERLVTEGLWDKTAPGPELPGEVIEGTIARYAEARDRLLS